MEIGVIGAGEAGRNHVRVYAGMRKVDSVRVYDLNRAVARALAARTGAVACDTAEELLGRVDAVSICVPTPHRSIAAEAAFAHGVHLLIERPACGTAREARQLAEAVPDGLIAGVGHVARFNPVVAELKRLVARPLFVEARRHNPAGPRRTNTSVVEDLMIHDVDVMGCLFPGVAPLVSSCGTPDVCSALLSYGDVPVQLSASRRASRKIRTVYVEEEDLTIEGDYMNQEVTVYRRPEAYGTVDDRYVQENVTEKVLVNRVEPLQLELATFVDCVRGGRPFPVTLAEGAANLEVCERIAACLAAGRASAAPPAGLARG